MRLEKIGIWLGLLSGFLWGCMDVAAQYLLHNAHLAPAPFISLTMFVSVACLFPIVLVIKGKKTFAPVSSFKNLGATLIFAVLILSAEATFFSCIKFSNASTASVLAATRPFWIMGILATFAAILPTWRQILCGIMAVVGVGLLVTQGNMSNLSLNLLPLLCGLGAALASAGYTVQSRDLVARVGPFIALLWAMVFACFFANLYHPMWETGIAWSPINIFCVFWVAIIGHVCAYCCYLASAGKINPSVTGLLETVEPLSAILLSYLFFKTFFDMPMVIGGALILISVVILSYTKKPTDTLK